MTKIWTQKINICCLILDIWYCWWMILSFVTKDIKPKDIQESLCFKLEILSLKLSLKKIHLYCVFRFYELKDLKLLYLRNLASGYICIPCLNPVPEQVKISIFYIWFQTTWWEVTRIWQNKVKLRQSVIGLPWDFSSEPSDARPSSVHDISWCSRGTIADKEKTSSGWRCMPRGRWSDRRRISFENLKSKTISETSDQKTHIILSSTWIVI